MKQIAVALAQSLVVVNWIQAGKSLPDIEVVKTENRRCHFRRVAMNQADTRLAVSERTDTRMGFGLSRGHANIAAFSADNELIAETTAVYSPHLLTRHTSRKGGVHFSAKLPRLACGCPYIRSPFTGMNPNNNKIRRTTKPSHAEFQEHHYETI